MALRITIDADLCMGSGYCLRDIPALLQQDPDGLATVRDESPSVPVDLVEEVQQAALNCPSGAIELVDE